LEQALVGDGRAVAGAELHAIQLHRSAGDMQPGLAGWFELKRNLLLAVEQRAQDVGVLPDVDRSLAAALRGQQTKLAAAVFQRKCLLLVPRSDAARIRHDPDLQEVHRLLARGVVLAVHHAAACAYPLHDTRTVHTATAA